MTKMGLSQHEKMRSLQHHSSKSSKEKGLFTSGVKNVDLTEKVIALRTEKLPRHTAKDQYGVKKNSVASPLGTSQKPRPDKKLTRFEEPIKNMSKVPCYLQRAENRGNIHGKALNFGVMDWGLLERWTYQQKCVTDVGGGESTSGCTESSTFSTFDFTNRSRRTMSYPLSRGKKSLPAFSHKKPPVRGRPTKTYERENSGHIDGFSDSTISSTKFPTRHDKHSDAEFCLSADVLGHNKNLDLKAISDEVHQTPQSAILPSRYKIDDIAAARVVEDKNGSLTKAEMSQHYLHGPSMANNMPQFSQDSKIRWGCIQDSVNSGCLSSDSPLTSDGWLAERNSNNHSGNLAEDVEIINQYPHVPHSCPLTCTTMNDEADRSCSLRLRSETVIQTDKSICRNGSIVLFSRGPCEQVEVTAAQDSRKSKARAMAAPGKKSSDNLSRAGPKQMRKISSLREGSSEEQFESISCLYNSHGDQATRNNKGNRQSPLRRLLDPLLKPKNNLAFTNRHSCKLVITDKPSHGLHKLSNTSVDSTCQGRRSMDTLNQLSNNGKRVHQDEINSASMKQAFLQLAWKNGLPLFMLSSSDTEVLAATISMRCAGNNDNLECIYRIFSVKDSKKKSMFWSNPGNKGNKHQFISNIVGRLKVSLCELKSYEYDESFHVLREFVLLGVELPPTSHKPFDSPTKSELAAIVVNVPLRRPKSLSIGMLCRSKCRGSLSAKSNGSLSAPNEEKCLQTDQHYDVVDQSGISVILPSGAHGLSTDGEPSPLIERWRSGGACDCGGWDEGCKLSILSNEFQDSNISGSFKDCQITDGTNGFKLFLQGGSQEKRHAFSMVSLREGHYAVDFLSSISLLQAFGTCIAILHGRKNYSVETKSLREHISNDHLERASARTQGDPASYVPNHPPLSPVGRA